MFMKYSGWYSGFVIVDLRIGSDFPNWRGIDKRFFDLQKPILKNLDNPGNFFSDYQGFPVPAEKNGFQIWNLHPK